MENNEINTDIWKVENYMKEGYTASEFTNQSNGSKKWFITVYCEIDGMPKPFADTVVVPNCTSLQQAFDSRTAFSLEFKKKIEQQIADLKKEMSKAKLVAPNGAQIAALNNSAGKLIV